MQNDGALQLMSLSDIMQQNYPDTNWILPGIIPTGLTILAGPSKAGKSWFALNLALAVSMGKTFGEKIEVEKNSVLYLALEDTEKRLQIRVRSILKTDEIPEDLFITTNAKPLDEGLIESFRDTLTKYPQIRLIIIDVIQKVLPNHFNKRGASYGEDYQNLSQLKRFADEAQISILLIHHTTKREHDDVFKEVAGSVGVVACSDTTIVFKRKRNSNTGTLEITGRDVEETSLGFSLAEGVFSITGTPPKHVPTQKETIKKLLEEKNIPLSIDEILEPIKEKYPNATKNSLNKTLSEMTKDNLITRPSMGKYTVLPEKSSLLAS